MDFDLNLRLVGIEKVCWTNEQFLTDDPSEDKKKVISKLIDESKTLHSFKLNEGKSVDEILKLIRIPFSVFLPEWVPSSFFMNGENNCYLTVSYSLYASLEPSSIAKKSQIIESKKTPYKIKRRLIIFNDFASQLSTKPI